MSGAVRRAARESAKAVWQRLCPQHAPASYAPDEVGFAPNRPDLVRATWLWRPPPWDQDKTRHLRAVSGTQLSTETALFFDTDPEPAPQKAEPETAIPVAQQPRPSKEAPDSGARSSVHLDLSAYRGRFVSCAIDMPEAILPELSEQRILQVDTAIETDLGRDLFVRLNMKQGPNLLQETWAAVRGAGAVHADFDLDHIQQGTRPISQCWIDLIFDAPGGTQILLHDVVFSLRRRAAL